MAERIPHHTPEFQKDGEWVIASCTEFPEANGLGKSEEEAGESLAYAIAALEQDREKR